MGLGRKKKERGEKSGNKVVEKYRGETGIVEKTRFLEVKSRYNIVSRMKNRGLVEKLVNKKKENLGKGVLLEKWRRPTLPQRSAVPSARASLTSLFGMGRGGSSLL